MPVNLPVIPLLPIIDIKKDIAYSENGERVSMSIDTFAKFRVRDVILFTEVKKLRKIIRAHNNEL